MNFINNAAIEPTPTNAVIETILSRSAAKYYDTTATLSDDLNEGTQPPTHRAQRVYGSGGCYVSYHICAEDAVQ